MLRVGDQLIADIEGLLGRQVPLGINSPNFRFPGPWFSQRGGKERGKRSQVAAGSGRCGHVRAMAPLARVGKL